MPDPSWLPPELERARKPERQPPQADRDDLAERLAASEESRRRAEERLAGMLDAHDAQLAELERLTTRLQEAERELERANARLAESENG
jgi:hypothetical protein